MEREVSLLTKISEMGMPLPSAYALAAGAIRERPETCDMALVMVQSLQDWRKERETAACEEPKIYTSAIALRHHCHTAMCFCFAALNGTVYVGDRAVLVQQCVRRDIEGYKWKRCEHQSVRLTKQKRP